MLTDRQALHLAEVFSGEIAQQGDVFEGYFFEIFDFSIIPVEVISGIYESLIDEETRDLQSAVYTPPFLVEYILNDTIDIYLKENCTSECKIFEVAVGSGIFLVQSLRRMIEKEIEINGQSQDKEFSERIRNIAKHNLFGVDINPEALKVTCFSIYIALLDYQEPKNINKYEFPNLLNENLFEANFFDTEHAFNQIINSIKPQYILGNPPWKNGAKDKIHVEYLKNNNLTNIVSDFQLAQSFLLRTKDFSAATSICALIVTSKALYNNAELFKEKFLKEAILYKCLDLSCVRRLIFEHANNPAMILQYQYSNIDNVYDNIVSHLSLKYNLFIKNFKMLTFEKMDFKRIKQEFFIKHKWMFKVALYGNTLDFNLLLKIASNPTSLGEYLNENNIYSGNGIKRGTPKKFFDFLIGLPILESSDIKDYYTVITENLSKLENKEDVYLEAGRDLKLFKGPKILLGKRTKKESYLNISLVERDCVFRDSVNAITFKAEDSNMKWIYSLLISKLYTYYQYLTSSNWGGYYPEIHKQEYLSFPLKEYDSNQKIEANILVDDFLEAQCFEENISLTNSNLEGVNSLVNDIYDINNYEKDLIDYILNVARYQFQESKQHLVTDFTYLDKNHYRNQTKVLKSYAEVFLNEFEKIYNDEYIQVEIYALGYFIAMNFVFHSEIVKDKIVFSKDKLNEAKVFKILGNLSITQITNTTDPTKNLFIQKDIKGFEENSFYVIKPNEYKCWHRAIAWSDVAEFKAKIEEAELIDLNNNPNE